MYVVTLELGLPFKLLEHWHCFSQQLQARVDLLLGPHVSLLSVKMVFWFQAAASDCFPSKVN